MHFRKNIFALFIGLVVTVFFYSCKKADDATHVPEPAAEKVKLSVHLTGDFSVDESPMNNVRKSGYNSMARDVYDSTVYAVDVRRGASPYAAGLFDKEGIITLEVDKGATYTINVAAIKKGTSIGLYWGIVSGGEKGYRHYSVPIRRRLLNEMEYSSKVVSSPWALDPSFLSSMSYLSVRGDVISADEEVYYHAELDSHFGSTVFTVGDIASSLNIPLKRISFGLQYKVANFTEGTLIAEYGGLMKPQSFTYYGLYNSLRIYTADAFRFGDEMPADKKIHLTLKWKKPNGSISIIGEKDLLPKRNSLTTINVTMPSLGLSDVNINLSDTTFLGNKVVNL